MMSITQVLSVVVPVVLAVVLIRIILAGYVKAPSDKAYIISGFRREPKVLIGRAGIKIPFLDRKDELMLKQISIDIKTNGFVPTTDFIGVDIDAVAKVRVLTERDLPMLTKDAKIEMSVAQSMVKAAMRNFLNMSEEQIVNALTDSLQGNMREIIGAQTLRELCQNRKAFGDEVQDKAQKDMNALGIWIESCNIQKLEDERGLINALGMDNMAKIQKDAAIAKAEADRDVAIAEAEARRIANDAKIKSDSEIASRENELLIKKAELKRESDLKKAEADAAYKIQEQAQRKTIEVASTDADIARQERGIELKKKEAEAKEQELAATIKKQADAEKYRQEQIAQVELFKRQKEAEAKKFEQEREAEALRIKADAIQYQAEKEAEAIRIKGIAEAEAIRAKGIAEAEATEKRADAMSKMKEAAILEMFFNVLPDVAASVAKPLENIDKITMYGEGNTAKLVGDITKATSQITDGLTSGLGFDMKSVIAGVLGAKVAQNKRPEDTYVTEESVG